jgi:hypothetical protein
VKRLTLEETGRLAGLSRFTLPRGPNGRRVFQDPHDERLIHRLTSAADRARRMLWSLAFVDRRDELDLRPRVIANGMMDDVAVMARRPTCTAQRNG